MRERAVLTQIALHPRVTPEAVELVKRFEGLRLRAAALPGGGFVIGHGHVSAQDPGREITAAEARALLLFDLSRLAAQIEPLILAPVTPAQFDAMLSFAFGVGAQDFARSVVLKRLNAGDYLDAAAAIELWRCARIDGQAQVIDVLVRRRAVEKARFLEPPEGFAPAPSALLKPEADDAVLALAAALTGRGAVRDGTGREGEPAPSAALAVVAALSARLDRLLVEEPEPPPIAVPPASPEPVAPEPPPPEPVPPAQPAARVEAPAPAPEPAPPRLPWSPAPDLDRPKAPRVSPPSLRGPSLVLGVFALLLFAVAVLKTYQAPSLTWLALGFVAVIAMVPASLFLIGPRRPSDD